MNEEIKKILDYLKNNTFIPDETKRKYKILHRDEVNRLLNYITNLQEENKKLKETNEEHRKINGQLQEENKFLKDYKNAYGNVLIANKMLEKENQKLVKVIEEINKCLKKYAKTSVDDEKTIIEFYKQLKNILNKLTELKGGGSNE